MSKVVPTPADIKPCALEDIYELAAAARDDGGNPQHRPEEQWFRYEDAGMICLWEPQNRSGTKRISHWWVREDRRDEEIGPALLDRAIETAVESEGSRLDIYVYEPAPVEDRGFRPATGGNARDDAQYYERDISAEQATDSPRPGNRPQVPRAMIHKQILDEAASRPDAPMAELAQHVSGASLDLVEKVLDEYGDPADDRADALTSQEKPTSEQEPIQEEAAPEKEAAQERSNMDQGADTPTAQTGIGLRDSSPQETYTVKQFETLRLVHNRPEASQRELGEELGVSASAVSNRLTNIRGFEWNNRRGFVDTVFVDDQPGTSPGQPSQGSIEDLRQHVADLEQRVEAIDSRVPQAESEAISPELVHKVIRVCMESDQITNEEEFRLLNELIGT